MAFSSYKHTHTHTHTPIQYKIGTHQAKDHAIDQRRTKKTAQPHDTQDTEQLTSFSTDYIHTSIYIILFAITSNYGTYSMQSTYNIQEITRRS